MYETTCAPPDKCGHCFLIHYPAGVYSGEKIADVFAYESSEIDWCEDNYKHSEHVVEYFNTVSSAGMLASPRTRQFVDLFFV